MLALQVPEDWAIAGAVGGKKLLHVASPSDDYRPKF
jgi:hypothetical protein